MKLFFAILLTVCAASLHAASPAFTDFNTDQFNTAGNKVAVKSGAGFTNTLFFGQIKLPINQGLDAPFVTNTITLYSADGAHQISLLQQNTGAFTLESPTTDILLSYSDVTRIFGMMGIGITSGTNLTNVGTINGFTVGPPGITNFTTVTNGYVKTVSTPTRNTYNDAQYSLQDWYDSGGFLYASVSANPADGTSRYGHLSLFGTAVSAYGNLCGFNVWNTNLNGGAIIGDRRAFVFRVKDPAGGASDQGGYTLFENRYDASAPDKDTSFANTILLDQFGNVGLGDMGARSDATPGVHPWSKVSIYGSHSRSYPTLGMFPYNVVATPITNSFEYDGTNFYMTDKNLARFTFLRADTNQVTTNLVATGTTTAAALTAGNANTAAGLLPGECALLLTNSSASGQLEATFWINNVCRGGLRADVSGNINWHAQVSHTFYTATNTVTANHTMTLFNAKVGIGTAASVEPKEKLVVSGNVNITNGVLRLSSGSADPSSSNLLSQVFSKTNLNSAANAELYTMDGSGFVSPLGGPRTITKTTNYLVATSDNGFYFNNIGTTIITTNVLPVPLIAGYEFTFIVQTNKAMWIQATNSTVRLGASVSTNGGFLNASAIGSVVTVRAISTNEWYAMSHEGTWTAQ